MTTTDTPQAQITCSMEDSLDKAYERAGVAVLIEDAAYRFVTGGDNQYSAPDATVPAQHGSPENVDARVEEALETCASRPAIAADATGLLSNFIGCVEKGRGSALDAGDRAQAAEIARLADVPALLAAERAKAQAMQKALERVRDELGRCRNPQAYHDAAVFSLRVITNVLNSFRPRLQGTKKRQAPPDEQPAPSESAGLRGEPCLRVDADGDVVRSIRIEPGMTDAEVNAAAAVADRLGDGYDLARELAACLAEMRLGRTATKCPVFPEEIAAASALDRADAALAKARAAGLLPEGEGRRDNG